MLGASIQLPGRSPLSDAANDRQVTIVSGSSTVQRSFVIPAAAPPGSYNLLVSLVEDLNNNRRIDAGDRNLALRTFTGALQVTPPAPPPVYFDFSLSVNPTSGKIARGETVSTTVTTTLTSGTTQPVSFSVTGLPSGVSVNALSSGSPTISRGLAFTAASNAVLGIHTITITATGGGITRTATYTLTVLCHDEEIHIFEIEPGQGIAGDVVTIKGANFAKLPLYAEVMFGGQRVEILSRDTKTLPNKIVVEVPVLDLRWQRDKAVDVYLAYGFPILYVLISNKVKFTYKEPVLTDISPSRTMPNRQVILTGDYFGDGERGGLYFVKFGAERFYAPSEKVCWSNNRIGMNAPRSLGLGGTDVARAVEALWALTAIGKSVGWGLVETVAPELVDWAMPPHLRQPVPVSDDDEAWLLWVRSFIAEILPAFDITLAGDLTVKVTVTTPVGKSEPRYFTFTREWVPINGDLYWTAPPPDIMLFGHSPAEFRVYDSQGRVTGLVEGELKEEIPHSLSVRNAIFIFDATDSYRFEVVGTDEGSYGIDVISVGEDVTIVGVTEVPTSKRVVHRYTINWDALRRGEPSISVQIDSDGDKIFEQTKILQPPIASFAYSPEEMIVDQPITFDASGSSDPDGEIMSYEWHFGDGTTGTGKVVEHIFTLAGNYTVTLTIADNDGVVNSFSKIVEVVLPQAPDIGERLLDIGQRLLRIGERLLAQFIQLVQLNPWIAAGIAALGLLILLIKRWAA
ncbi:MAG: Microbial collagenase [Chloroflexi bacterium]|nr:Microbial collagenase [Chloroflexota bacterium]